MSRVREDRKSSDPLVADAPSVVAVVVGRAVPGRMIVLLPFPASDMTLDTRPVEMDGLSNNLSTCTGIQSKAKETILCPSRGTAMKRSEGEGTSAAVLLRKEAIRDV